MCSMSSAEAFRLCWRRALQTRVSIRISVDCGLVRDHGVLAPKRDLQSNPFTVLCCPCGRAGAPFGDKRMTRVSIGYVGRPPYAAGMCRR